MIFAGILLIAICLVGAYFFKEFFTKPTGGGYKNITDMESAYTAETEIAQAMERLKSNKERATVISRSGSGQRHVALTFDGLTDRVVIQQILDLLQKYNMKATFFVDGMQTAEDPQNVTNIEKAGQKIENYTLMGMVKMETMPVDRIVRDFCRSAKIIKVTTDKGPNLLKCNETQYTDLVLQAAKASGFQSVVKSDVFLNVKEMKKSPTADGFVAGIAPGSIVSVKLKPNVEPVLNEEGKTNLKPAIDKQPGLKELHPPETGDKETVEAVEKMLISLQKANYTTVYVEDFRYSSSLTKQTTRLINRMASFLQEQAKAIFTSRTAYAAESTVKEEKEIKQVFTTEPALAYTFAGLTDKAVVDAALAKLQVLGIKATFFITENEMRKYPQTVREIIGQGHEIGIAVRPKDGETFDETRKNITRIRSLLQDQFGVTTKLVKQPSGAVTDTTRDAVAALGCQLIGQSINVVQSKHKDYTSADQVMGEIFGKSVFSLARGQIVHFRLDYYTNKYLSVDLIETIKQRKIDNIAFVTSYDNPRGNPENDSQYKLKPVGELLNNTKYIYHYPVDGKTAAAGLPGEGSLNSRNFLVEATKRYIGHPGVNYDDRMAGFSKVEVRRLDQTGFVHTNDKVIFLTFDDWGTDAALNKILYVLRKHNATATFFIITRNVMNNPNLLRSIALEGNDIGSHTDQHLVLVKRDPKTGKLAKALSKEEYVKDYTTAYQKLFDVTGDLTVNGKPALTKFIRPVGLAISKPGMEAMFEAGYQYVISGSSSTYDYKAKNVTELVRTMKNDIYLKNGELNKGAILVMHMSDTSVFTAMALDILLTANETKSDDDPTKFKVGRLSDYVKDGYVQMSRKYLDNQFE